MEEENNCHIIIDNGTNEVKAGFSKEEVPKIVFPNILLIKCDEFQIKDYFVFNYSYDNIEIDKDFDLNLKYPIENGTVTDWNDMEKIWDKAFEKLGVSPSEYNVMITENSLNTKINREKISEIMFENFDVPGLYITNPAVLSLISSGRFSGIVIDSGEGITSFVPIFDGYSLQNSKLRMDLAGKDITDYLVKNLEESGVSFNTLVQKKIISKLIKEKTCYVAFDFEKEKNNYKSMTYEMPDGKLINVKDERFRAPEILFHPEMSGKYFGGIHQFCCDSINKSDVDLKKDLYNCIYLSGGSTLFSGLSERLTKEIQKIAPEIMKYKVRVIADTERKYSAWIGGALLSSDSNFDSMWITRDEYNEDGPSIIHKKCF